MKKLIGLIALTAFAVNVLAQEPAPSDKMGTSAQVQKSEQKVKDGISFKSGKAWMTKDGKTVALDKEATLANGTRVTPSGHLIMKDGSKAMLKEGDFVAMDGTIERAVPVKATDRKEAYPEKDANK